MRRRPIISALASCGLLLSFLAAPFGTLAAAKAPARYERLFYYTEGSASKRDFFSHWRSVDVFAPQVYGLLADGTLSGSLDPDLAAFARAHRIKIEPVVTNDGFGQASYRAVLSDPAKEASAIATLVSTAKSQGYAGWQFDFEQMDASYRDDYSAFIAQAAGIFHAAGLILSVAVVAKVSDTPSDYKGDLYQKLIGVYDYSALAESADFISLMSYDDPASPGPSAPLPWVKQVLAYSLERIPAKKLSLGIPLYYWLRRDDTNALVEIGGVFGIDNAFRKHYVSVHWSGHSQVPYLEWKHAGVGYTLWYENARSAAAKVALVKADGLYGASLWAFGLPLPSVYGSLRE